MSIYPGFPARIVSFLFGERAGLDWSNVAILLLTLVIVYFEHKRYSVEFSEPIINLDVNILETKNEAVILGLNIKVANSSRLIYNLRGEYILPFNGIERNKIMFRKVSLFDSLPARSIDVKDTDGMEQISVFPGSSIEYYIDIVFERNMI